ncbi:unnamed protein product [Ectocarpus sp. 8 AP-2014]
MDSLTKRLMSRSGLNPVDPTLPPVHNMRMVYLKEEFGDAEEALHEARLALESVQAGGLTDPLYAAMAKLEVSERDYFARRYFGSNKAVLKGWNVDWKQRLFKDKITELSTAASARPASALSLDQTARNAATACAFAYSSLKEMNNQWFPYANASGDRLTTTPNFGTRPQSIIDRIAVIRTNLNTALALPDTDATKQASVSSVRASLRDAEICQRLAQLVMNNRWDLPDDLRKPAPVRP